MHRLKRLYGLLPQQVKPLARKAFRGVRRVVPGSSGGKPPVPPTAAEIAAVMAEPDYPRVTVVVPAYNEATHLTDCLASVRSQSVRSIECLVIDDCSTDDTAAVAAAVAALDPRVRVIANAENRGLPGSRNVGLVEGAGAFVTFLDGDDFLFPDSIRARLAALEARADEPDVIGTYCDWMPLPEDAELGFPTRKAVAKPDASYLQCDGEIPFIATAPLLRRAPFVALGGFDETFGTGEDFECWMRVMRHGYRFIYERHVGVAYRQRRGGMVQRDPAGHAEAALTVIRRMEAELPESDVVAGTPTVFRESLASYQSKVKTVRRVTASLALAVAADDDEQIARVSALLPRGAAAACAQALDPADIARRSLMRVHRADPAFSRADVEAAVVAAGYEPAVEFVMSPPWTTDDITAEGRAKLAAAGIAPPGAAADGPIAIDLPVECPRCGSRPGRGSRPGPRGDGGRGSAGGGRGGASPAVTSRSDDDLIAAARADARRAGGPSPAGARMP